MNSGYTFIVRMHYGKEDTMDSKGHSQRVVMKLSEGLFVEELLC